MEPAQVFGFIGSLLGAGSAIAVVTVALIQKFGKGPDQRHNEVAFGVGILEKQIERAANESARWLDVEKFLRDELRKAEADKARIEGLLETARDQIRSLQKERDELLNRQRLLVAKFTRGEQITLADITGQPDLDAELEDLEDTYIS